MEAIHESARASEPIPVQIQAEIRKAALVYADETPHFQSGEFLWLWVVASAQSVLFFIARRTQELLRGRIGEDFAGQGSLALATFASIIGTCRRCQASPLRYLHQVIAARRQGLEAPPLPPVPVAACLGE